MATDREKDIIVILIDKLDRMNTRLIEQSFKLNNLEEVIKKAVEEEGDEGATLQQNELLKSIMNNENIQNKLMEILTDVK